jgi:hypothetical protein
MGISEQFVRKVSKKELSVTIIRNWLDRSEFFLDLTIFVSSG